MVWTAGSFQVTKHTEVTRNRWYFSQVARRLGTPLTQSKKEAVTAAVQKQGVCVFLGVGNEEKGGQSHGLAWLTCKLTTPVLCHSPPDCSSLYPVNVTSYKTSSPQTEQMHNVPTFQLLLRLLSSGDVAINPLAQVSPRTL